MERGAGTSPVIPAGGAQAPERRDLCSVQDEAPALIERIVREAEQVPALRGCRRFGRDDGFSGAIRLLLAGVSLAFATLALPAGADDQSLYLFETYRPDADPAADLELAKARATAEDKRILIEVGGDWCIWCHILDRYLLDNPDVMAAYEDAFVVMKVNWARDDLRNEAFLVQYPERGGYPHFYILDLDGGFLASQNTVELEDGGESYDKDAMLAFARSWRRPGS